jgi:hypothetical protein
VTGAGQVLQPERIGDGSMEVELWRSACPANARPCGEACPYAEPACVARVALGVRAPLLRRLAEHVYCVGLTRGKASFQPGGCDGSVAFELERDEAVPGAPRVRSLHFDVAGYEQGVATSELAQPLLVRARNQDVYATGRIGPSYWAYSRWRASNPERRTRRVQAPGWSLGRDVLPGDFAAIEAMGVVTPLAMPSSEAASSRPLVEVVWCDDEGLARATRHAAANPERESAFLLVGSMHFCAKTAKAYTCVEQVVTVDRYEARDRSRASIAPEALREARARARARGLHIVGVLHSHVLEGEDAEHVHGLFYSGIDADDHANFLPPAWSLGGVINVRADGSVELGLFAQDAERAFAPLPEMLRIRRAATRALLVSGHEEERNRNVDAGE